MTLEMTMRQRVVKALKPLHAVSVENGCGVGTPDVNCAWGWIELKALPKAPVRETTPVRVPHFTPQQKIWLLKRDAAGGNACVLIMVGREWFMLSAAYAARHLGEAPMSELRASAVRYWSTTPTDKELLECFSKSRN